MIGHTPNKVEVKAVDEPQGYIVTTTRNKLPVCEFYFLSLTWEALTIEGRLPETAHELVVYVGTESFKTGISRADEPPVWDATPSTEPVEFERRDPTYLPAVVTTALAVEGVRVMYDERGRVINVDSPFPERRVEVVDPVVLTVPLDDVLEPVTDPWIDSEAVTVLDVQEDALPDGWSESLTNERPTQHH